MGLNSSLFLNMKTPNHFEVVKMICDHPDFKQLLADNTYASITQLMYHIGTALKDADPNWGFLSKTEGEKHLTLLDGRFISCDSFIYKTNNQVVDVLSNAVDSGVASPTWQFQPKRASNNWTEIDVWSNENDMKNLAQLEKDVEELKQELERIKASTIQIGDKITLRSAETGMLVCAEHGDHWKLHVRDRVSAGTWETFEIVKA